MKKNALAIILLGILCFSNCTYKNISNEEMFCDSFEYPKLKSHSITPSITIDIPALEKLPQYSDWDTILYNFCDLFSWDTSVHNLDSIKLTSIDTFRGPITGFIRGINKDGSQKGTYILEKYDSVDYFLKELDSKIIPIILDTYFYYDSIDQENHWDYIDIDKNTGYIYVYFEVILKPNLKNINQ